MKEQSNKTPNQKAPHILNASSSLLGICFVVLTSLKVLNVAKTTIIDEVATVELSHSRRVACSLFYL